MAVWTPTGLVVRKSATECSQLLIPKGSLSGDELRKPAPASLPLSWSFPLVLVLTRQSAASGKPLSAPFCLEKTSIHSRELMSVLPDDPSPGCLVLQSFSRNNGHRENGLFPKLHHWYHLTLHRQPHKIPLNTALCFQPHCCPVCGLAQSLPENTIAILPVLYTDKAKPIQRYIKSMLYNPLSLFPLFLLLSSSN